MPAYWFLDTSRPILYQVGAFNVSVSLKKIIMNGSSVCYFRIHQF